LRPYTSPEAEAPTRRGRLACAPARERLTSDVRGLYSTSLTIAHTGGAAHSPHEDPPFLRPAHSKQAEPLWELEEAECGRGDRPLSTMLCHLGNVSYKLGRDVRCDLRTEKFGETEANKLLRKECRAGYELPKV
jgi:hypothetical protein